MLRLGSLVAAVFGVALLLGTVSIAASPRERFAQDMNSLCRWQAERVDMLGPPSFDKADTKRDRAVDAINREFWQAIYATEVPSALRRDFKAWIDAGDDVSAAVDENLRLANEGVRIAGLPPEGKRTWADEARLDRNLRLQQRAVQRIRDAVARRNQIARKPGLTNCLLS